MISLQQRKRPTQGPNYKHLGSYIQDFAVNTKDARYRVAQAKQAAGQLQRSFFGKRNVSVATKSLVFQALVSSRQLFQTHTWSWITPDEVSRWNAGLRSNVSQIVKNDIRPIPAFRFTVEQLYALANLNAPRDLIHANRLRYLARIISKAPPILWRMLYHTPASQAWPKLLADSFQWLRTYSARVIPDLVQLGDICSYVSLHQRWSGTVKAALRACMAFHASEARGLLWTLRMEHFVQKWSDYRPDVCLPAGASWQCGECNQRFGSKRALAMHARQVHQYRKWQKYYALDVDCLACGKRYFARSRFISHLSTSTGCADIYRACFPPAPEEMVQQIEAEELEVARRLKSQGWRANKAFAPVLQIPHAGLPPAHSIEAKQMFDRWVLRNGSQGDAFNNLVGIAMSLDDSLPDQDCIVPFLGHTYGGHVAGHGGVFQKFGLSSLHAQIHIKSLVFVHFYSGYRRTGDLQWQIENFQVIENLHLFCLSIDLCLARAHSDLTDAETKEFWLRQIRVGNLLGLGGGPPCETWTAARLLDGGPPAVRHAAFPWGVPCLNKRQRHQVDIGSKLLTFLGDLLAAAALSGLCGFAEHPAYPAWAMPKQPPSIWTLPALRVLAKLECIEVATVDQCLLGHESKKPTTMMLLRLPKTAALIRSLGSGGRCNHSYRHKPLRGKDASGQFCTSSAKIYPVQLNELIALGVVEYLKDLGSALLDAREDPKAQEVLALADQICIENGLDETPLGQLAPYFMCLYQPWLPMCNAQAAQATQPMQPMARRQFPGSERNRMFVGK
eukprot:s3376_g1.t1